MATSSVPEVGQRRVGGGNIDFVYSEVKNVIG